MQTENLSQSVETNEKRKQEGRGGGEEDEEKEDENGNDDKSKITSMKSSIPLIISPIPRVSSLTKTQPSPLLLNNIVEVLYHFLKLHPLCLHHSLSLSLSLSLIHTHTHTHKKNTKP
jgi:hypothetical protein